MRRALRSALRSALGHTMVILHRGAAAQALISADTLCRGLHDPLALDGLTPSLLSKSLLQRDLTYKQESVAVTATTVTIRTSLALPLTC